MGENKPGFLESLFKQHSVQLQRFLARRLNDPQEAAEIAQEAYLRMQRLDAPEALDNARAFLFQVAANMATDHLRRQQLQTKYLRSQLQLSEATADIDLPSGEDPEQQLVAEQRLAQITAALDSMAQKPRQAFLLHRRSGLSYSQIAQEMGVSVSSVEKYILQALKHCRRELVISDGAEPET